MALTAACQGPGGPAATEAGGRRTPAAATPTQNPSPVSVLATPGGAHSTSPIDPEVPVARWLTIVHTGEVHGEIAPCG